MSFNLILRNEKENLIKEAKKYRTAEEFIEGLKKKGDIVYHGTNKTFDKFDINAPKRLGYKMGKGSYFTKDKKIADNLGKNGNIYYVDIKNKKLFNLRDDMFKQDKNYKIIFDVPEKVLKNAKKYNINNSKEFNQLKDIELRNKILEESGYDGLYNTKKDILIFNPEDLIPKTEVQLKEIWEQAHKELSKKENLIEEAKKYKSADEFVEELEKKGDIVYHGTQNKFDKFELRAGENTDTGMWGRGIYLTTDKKYAETYSRGKGIVMKNVVNLKNPYIIKTKEDIPEIKIPENTIKDLENADKNYSKEFTKKLKQQGYDGVIVKLGYTNGNKEIVVFDPKDIKTEVQLKKIRKQAHK